jgi:tetratricopeptide (TPR) repeat protein
MKRVFIGWGLLVGLTLVCGTAQAQTGTAMGKVLDEQGKPIIESKVEIDYQGGMNRHYATKTNKKGEYTQVGLPPGMYKFTLSKEGYQTVTIEWKIGLGDPTEIAEVKLRTVAQAQAAAASSPENKAARELQENFEKAVKMVDDGKLDDAITAYKEILAQREIPQVRANLGHVYAQKRDWVNAEAEYKKALELKPDLQQASFGLVQVLQASGRKDEAAAMMAQLGNTDDPKLQFNMGILALNSGKYEEAATAFKKVEAADPTNAEVQYHLATIALNLGKSDEAVTRLEKYLSMNPTNAQNATTAKGLLAALKPKK